MLKIVEFLIHKAFIDYIHMSFSINFGCRSAYVTIKKTEKKKQLMIIQDQHFPSFVIILIHFKIEVTFV